MSSVLANLRRLQPQLLTASFMRLGVSALLTIGILHFSSTPAAGQSCTELFDNEPRYGPFSEVLVQSEDLTNQELQNTVDQWNGCSTSGSGFPTLLTAPPNHDDGHYIISIEVQKLNGAGNGHCGEFTFNNTLKVFKTTKLPNGETKSCGHWCPVISRIGSIGYGAGRRMLSQVWT